MPTFIDEDSEPRKPTSSASFQLLGTGYTWVILTPNPELCLPQPIRSHGAEPWVGGGSGETSEKQ